MRKQILAVGAAAVAGAAKEAQAETWGRRRRKEALSRGADIRLKGTQAVIAASCLGGC